MKAVLKREFKSYFTNMIGYLIVAVLLFLISLFYSIYNIASGYPYFGYALGGCANYLIIIFPILTMKCFSDERKTKTDQLLLTSPVSVTKIVLGKFFAMAGVFLIPVLVSCLYPLLLLKQTYHNMAIDFSCILAFFLLGLVYVSIGMFISSLTESQIIAAVLSFVVFFLMYIMKALTAYIPSSSLANAVGFCIIAFLVAWIWKVMTNNIFASGIVFLIGCAASFIVYFVKGDILYGSITKLLNIISFTDGISSFTSGVFDVGQIVMFLSVIFFFIFLTIQSVQKRRWN